MQLLWAVTCQKIEILIRQPKIEVWPGGETNAGQNRSEGRWNIVLIRGCLK